MAFNMTSFFAGVGTVVAAVTLGFAGGAMITTSTQVDPPNRLERVAGTASTPARDSGAARRASATTAMPSQEPPASANIENALAPSDRVIPLAPAAAARPEVSPQPAPAVEPPVLAKDDAESPPASLKKARDDEMKKAKTARNAARRAERRRERRMREIEAAENAMLAEQRDGGPQEMSQRYDSGPRFGFFGND